MIYRSRRGIVVCGKAIAAIVAISTVMQLHASTSARAAAQGGAIAEYPISSSSIWDSIVAGPGGDLWFSEGGENAIGRMTSKGVLVAEYQIPGGNDGNKYGYPASLTTISAGPSSITVGSDGDIWFSGQHAGQPSVGRITPDGQRIDQFVIAPVVIPGGTDVTVDTRVIDAMTVGPDGNLWVSLSGLFASASSLAGDLPGGGGGGQSISGGVIGYVTLPSTPPAGGVGVLSLAVAYRTPPPGSSLVVGKDHNFWFEEPYPNNTRIARVTPAGVVTEFSVRGVSSIGNLTLGTDGCVWFDETQTQANGGQSGVGEICSNGGSRSWSTEALGIGADPAGHRYEIDRMTAGHDGNMWLLAETAISSSNPQNYYGVVVRLTSSLDTTAYDMPSALPPASLGGITAGPDGNIWFLEANRDLVARLLVPRSTGSADRAHDVSSGSGPGAPNGPLRPASSSDGGDGPWCGVVIGTAMSRNRIVDGRCAM